MKNEQIISFLNSYDYDIRKSGNARWIDQKCTCDVLSIIADCILEHTNYDETIKFSINDIWQSEYANENVTAIFSKPGTDSTKAKNEYDKFFSQPINLFTYSGILTYMGKKGNKNFFVINNMKLLEFIAMRDMNALLFLQLYIEKVLLDSGIYDDFQQFLEIQTKDSFKKLKDSFINFTIEHTPINQSVECGRIFTKILNPLAFKKHKKGTKRGHLSKTIITLDELKYNRINWRDAYSGKDKNITRKEYEKIGFIAQKYTQYTIQKAKKIVRRYNDKFNNGLPEVKQNGENVNATQIHHIFPANEFPNIADFVENLIALTPNQHFSYAHPNNQTNYIDRDFQYICLLAKTNTIMNDLTQTYDFNNYKLVLNEGLNTKDFETIFDFATLVATIDYFYSDFKAASYQILVEHNKPKI